MYDTVKEHPDRYGEQYDKNRSQNRYLETRHENDSLREDSL